MFLGIEIGGTKLQLAVGAGDGSELVALETLPVIWQHGANGILDQIRETGGRLLQQHSITCLGIGFGGPVDARTGRVVTSHQINGWDGFPLVAWCQQQFDRPVVLGNDCDSAALAEARFGAGRGRHIVFYVTVGTGVGGGLVIDGKLHGAGRPSVAEIGHLRPGLECTAAEQTVESIASGQGLENAARALLTDPESLQADCTDLLQRAGGNPGQLTARLLGEASRNGNALARTVIARGVATLGWAIAQVINLVAPEVVAVGGGVSLMGEELFYEPLRQAVRQYSFPPLKDSAQIVAPKLGEAVVVHGALALAADAAGIEQETTEGTERKAD